MQRRPSPPTDEAPKAERWKPGGSLASLSNASITWRTAFGALALMLGKTGRDDSHITYFAADQLHESGSLQTYSGERAEQSSTLSFTVLLATLTYLVPGDPPAAWFAPFVSLFFLLACFFPLRKVASRADVPPPCLVAALTTLPLLYWSLSGMEGSLYAFLLFCLLCLLPIVDGRSAFRLLEFALFVAIITTRPEAIIVLACAIGGAEALRAWKSRRFEVANLLILAAAFLAVYALKSTLGLDYMPMTAYAKQAHTLENRLLGGLLYFTKSMKEMPLLAASVIASFVAFGYRVLSRPFDLQLATAFCLVVSIFAFAFLSGGDWMEYGRFLGVPVVLCILFGIASVPAGFARNALVCAMILVNVQLAYVAATVRFGGISLLYAPTSTSDRFVSSPLDLYNRIHVRDFSFTHRLLSQLDRDERESITLGSHQAGYVAYYAMRNTTKISEFVDFMGLASTHVHRCGIRRNTFYNVLAKRPDKLSACGLKLPDYVFDVDSEGWPRLKALARVGCTEVFKQELEIRDVPWKWPLETRQFLADCSGASPAAERGSDGSRVRAR
jgi:hypothetical protein